MTPNFRPARQGYDLKSQDGHILQKNMTVYQLNKSPNDDSLILIEFVIQDILPDNRVSVQASFKIGNTIHSMNNTTVASSFYVSAEELLRQRLANIKYALEIDLPKQYSDLSKIVAEKGFLIDQLLVGDSNSEQEI